MTSNTAAALMALEQKWRRDRMPSNPGQEDYLAGQLDCADELAAVLTQEGAEGVALQEERRKFQQETLRTSELTQMLTKFVEEMHREHEQGAWSKGCVRCQLVTEAKELLARPINAPAEPRAAEGAGMACDWCGQRQHEEPTAAAAVAAGGDNIPPPMKLRTLGTGVLKTDAPRGGVTDDCVAVPKSVIAFLNGQIDHDGLWFGDIRKGRRYWWRELLPPIIASDLTPPAAQAQDARQPKARHIKQALAEFADIHMSEQVCAEVQKLAHAMAAKEAK